jgi:hypothetical protein
MNVEQQVEEGTWEELRAAIRSDVARMLAAGFYDFGSILEDYGMYPTAEEVDAAWEQIEAEDAVEEAELAERAGA